MNKRPSRNYLDLILYKAYADLKAEAARGYLGTLWWVLEPVLYLGVFYIVFSVIRYRDESDFISFMLIGLVVWKWFASTVAQGAKSVSGGAALMQQVYLPKYIFPVVVAVTNLVKFGVVFALLLAYLVFYGVGPHGSWGVLPLLVLLQFVMSLAVAGILSAMLPFLPDMQKLIENALGLLFFLSGVIFNVNQVPEDFRPYLYLNPMVTLIENYRAVIIGGETPAWGALGFVFLFSMVGLVIAIWLLDRFDRVYPKVLVR